MTDAFGGKTLVITGATGAIASAVALQAAAQGARLVLGDIGAEALDALCAQIGAGRCATLAGDVRDPENAAALVALARTRFGGIDALIPAAGIYRDRAFAEMSAQDWRETMEINLDAIFHLIRTALPALNPGAAIVNLTSIAAHRGSPRHAHYAATKGALLSLTRSLAQELAPQVRVNAVSPGIIETQMTRDLLAEHGGALRAATPLDRFGTAEEVARAILFLAGPASSFITGEVIHVNGGLYMD